VTRSTKCASAVQQRDPGVVVASTRRGAARKRRIDLLQLFVAQLQVGRSRVFVDARLAARAGDRDDALRARQYPRQSELRGGDAARLRELLDLRDQVLARSSPSRSAA
jgi:hypothetical protein